MKQDKQGMFLFVGYFNAIDLLGDDAKKWRLLKAIYGYAVYGRNAPSEFKNDSIFCLIKSMYDGMEAKSCKRSVANEQKNKGNNKTAGKNNNCGSEKKCKTNSKFILADKTQLNGIENENENKNKNENKIEIENENKNKNKKEIEKEIYKEKEQEKISSLNKEDYMCLSRRENDENLKNDLLALGSLDNPIEYEEELNEYARNLEQSYLSAGGNEDIFAGLGQVGEECPKMVNPIPTKQEVIDYVSEMKLSVSAELFFNYHDERKWVVGGRKVVDWKALLVRWDNSIRVVDASRIKNCPPHREFNYSHREKSSEELNSVLSQDLEEFNRLLEGE